MNSDKAERKREAEQGISVSDGPGDVSYFRTLAPSIGVCSISPRRPPSPVPRPPTGPGATSGCASRYSEITRVGRSYELIANTWWTRRAPFARPVVLVEDPRIFSRPSRNVTAWPLTSRNCQRLAATFHRDAATRASVNSDFDGTGRLFIVSSSSALSTCHEKCIRRKVICR